MDKTESDSVLASEGEITGFEPYPRGWKLMRLTLWERPKGTRQWTTVLWGFDIFLWRLPFLKTILAINVLVWITLILFVR